MHSVIDVLREYSELKISAFDAMSALGLQCQEDFFSATLAAGFHLPRVSDHAANILTTKALAWLGVADA
jgi:hypothetical protein